MVRISIIILLTGLSYYAAAQELNCRIVVNAERAQTTERQVFRDMEDALEQFMNNRQWTNDEFQPEERINCSISITITDMPSIGTYNATAQIQSSRPIYNTNYESLMLNFADRDWNFDYTESQPLEYSQNYFNNNLTSMMAFYAYMILGVDYDSFSERGGTKYYQKALDIVNLAQTSNIKGWQAFDNNRNRYWLVENYTNKQMDQFRTEFYKYHRQGMDVFLEKPEEVRKNAISMLKALQEIDKIKPNSILKISFFDAKIDEIVNIFKRANPTQKRQAYDICTKLEPNSTDEFEAILEN